jgi:hypothetical protein
LTDATLTGQSPRAVSTPTAQKYCSGCGVVIHKEAAQCPQCGAPQADIGGRKSRTTAILLAFLLGGLGAHKFYLGRIGWGVVYLLFCWTFVPAIVSFIEFIIYLTMSDAKFARKYG